MKDIEESSIIICSIVRDAEKGLKKNIPVIKELCKHFRDYQIIVYENDSTDDTKTLLQKWMEEDKQHVVALLNNTDSIKTIPSSKSVNANARGLTKWPLSATTIWNILANIICLRIISW